MLLRSLPNPHPTIILSIRFIRHYEDPTTDRSRQITLRNITYLHAVYNHVVVGVVNKRYPVLYSNTTPTTRDNGNHNKHPTQQHVPRQIMEKLTKITLT